MLYQFHLALRLYRLFFEVDYPHHLYVSYACPWACRTLIYRKLKGLEQHISVSVVHPDMMENGWFFDKNYHGATEDHLFGLKYLSQVYQKADTNITTSVTVPVLWDKKTNTIVNNESSEIIRMFNSSFNAVIVRFKAWQFVSIKYFNKTFYTNEK